MATHLPRPWEAIQGARRLPCASLLLAALAVALFLSPEWAARLEYCRALNETQPWRWITGHWTHFTARHLLWDVAGFLALAAPCELHHRGRTLLALVAASVLVSAGVWVFLPEMATYRGLSGLDSALFGLLCAMVLVEARARGRLLAVAVTALFALLFIGKIGYETFFARAVFVANLGENVVPVPLAHLIGAVTGLAAGLVPFPRSIKPVATDALLPHPAPQDAAGAR